MQHKQSWPGELYKVLNTQEGGGASHHAAHALMAGELVVVVNHCFTSLFGTNGLLSDIVFR